jgi:WD40 repeat protein
LEKVGDSFFVSGSYDGTLRIFNTKKIEMNIVTDSDAVYEIREDNNSDQRLKISCLSSFDRTYTAVVGTSKGIIKGFQLEKLNGKS